MYYRLSYGSSLALPCLRIWLLSHSHSLRPRTRLACSVRRQGRQNGRAVLSWINTIFRGRLWFTHAVHLLAGPARPVDLTLIRTPKPKYTPDVLHPFHRENRQETLIQNSHLLLI